MPIGKDSIKKRVAKVAPAEETAVETAEMIGETAPTAEPAPKKRAPAKKKAAVPAAEKPAAEKPAAKKSAAKKTAPAGEPSTAVLSNVSPETVEKVIGHAEDKPVDRVQIGQKMPTHLL